ARPPVVDAGALVALQRAAGAQVVLQAHREGVAVDAEAVAADVGIVVADPAGDRRVAREQVLAMHPGGPLVAGVDADVADRAPHREVGGHVADRLGAAVAAGLRAGPEAERVGRARRAAAAGAQREAVGEVLAVDAVVGDLAAEAIEAVVGVGDVGAEAAPGPAPGYRAGDVPVVAAEAAGVDAVIAAGDLTAEVGRQRRDAAELDAVDVGVAEAVVQADVAVVAADHGL